MLAAAVFALAGIGAGDWSLDNAFGLDLAGTGWALGALGAGILGGVGAAPQRTARFGGGAHSRPAARRLTATEGRLPA